MNAEVKTSSISGTGGPAQAILFPLDEIFPRDQYGKKGNYLQFLIALNQPLKTIQGHLDKHPELLNERDIRCYMLSPLAVCVISGRRKVAEMLLAKEADPTAVDKHGFSPLHHAAIRNDKKMENLLLKTNLAGLKAIRNCLGQTYQDIQKLFKHLLPKEDEVVFHFKNAEGIVVQGTARQFKEMMGKQFVRSSIFTRKSIYFHWMKGEFHLLPKQGTFNFLIGQYARYLNHPPRIYLDKKGCQNWGVFASEELDVDQVVCVYAGKQTEEEIRKEYIFRDIDGSRFSNEGPLINDSFPNCILSRVFYEDEWFSVVWTIRKIKPGEEFFLNYGDMHPAKMKRHLELNLQELEKFCRACPLPDLLMLLVQGRYEQDFLRKVKYLFCTPSSLSDLVLRKVIPIEDVNRCLGIVRTLKASEIEDFLYKSTEKVLSLLCNAFLPLKGTPIEPAIYQFFLKLDAQETCFIFLEAVRWMQEDSRSLKDMQDWKKREKFYLQRLEICKLMDGFVSNYLDNIEGKNQLDIIVEKIIMLCLSNVKELFAFFIFFLSSLTVNEKDTPTNRKIIQDFWTRLSKEEALTRMSSNEAILLFQSLGVFD